MAQIEAKVDWNAKLVRTWLGAYGKQVPFAIKNALNDVAFEARKSIGKSAKTVFDRPTAFIVNGWRVDKATKQNLTAIVKPEAKREPYLRANIKGGQRGVKPYEAAFKGAATTSPPSSKFFPTNYQRKDSKGNVTRGTLSKIIDSASKGAKGRNSYFIGRPTGGSRPYGVYQRMAKGLRPVFLAATRQMTYSPVYPIQEIGGKVVTRRYESYLKRRLEQAIKTAR